jgi:hypothetical protein
MSFFASDSTKFPSNSLQEYNVKFLTSLFDFAIFAKIIDASTSACVIIPDSTFLSHLGQRTLFFASK